MPFIMHRGNMAHWPMLSSLGEEWLSKLKRYKFVCLSPVYKLGETDEHVWFLLFGITTDDRVMRFECQGLRSPEGDPPTQITEMEAFRGQRLVDITMGHKFFVARNEEGALWFWEVWALPRSGLDIPKQFVESGIADVKCEQYLILALHHNGKVSCWENVMKSIKNKERKLVNFSTDNVVITQIDCGCMHSAALSDKGDLYTWGLNITGELGTGNMAEQQTPVRHNFKCKYIACGYTSTFAVTTNHEIYLAGNNSSFFRLVKTKMPIEKVFTSRYTDTINPHILHELYIAYNSFGRLLVWGQSASGPKVVPESSGEISMVDTLVKHAVVRFLNINIMFDWINLDPLRELIKERQYPAPITRPAFAPTVAEIFHIHRE